MSQHELITKADAVSQFTDNKSRKSSRKSDHSAKATVKTRGAISKDTAKKQKQFLIQRQSENLIAMFL